VIESNDSSSGPPGAASTPDTPPTGRAQAPESRPALLVVGIGASAGGLTPLGEFFDHMPAGSGLAFVVIQHLSPHGQSLLPDLLARHTAMEVRTAEEGLRIVPNTVYIIPPAYDLVLRGGLLRLQERDGPNDLHLPIDIFFRSLAEDSGAAGIGIILSGAGADGALGLRAIKEHSGLAIAQTPDSAEQSSMPRHAIETGVVDYVLPAADMPDILLNYAAHLQAGELLPRVARDTEANALKTVLAVLRARTGHDFALYRQSSILRRIQRRMLLCRIEEFGEYARYLHRNPDESQILIGELLIGVTEFFRDPEAFEAVREKVLPDLLGAGTRAPDDPLRVWVPACATGEEAYSLAILIREYLDETKQQVPVQIFATDIDERAIEKARRGYYAHTIAAQVSPQRLGRFFVRVDGDYQVSEAVRKMVVFATQSVTKDPPFSRIDLISCRNFLIYLESELQRAVMAVFAYSLKPGGCLLLGTSETPAQSTPYFEAVDRKWRIYRRLEGRAELGAMPLLPAGDRVGTRLPGGGAAARQGISHQVVERFLLENHLPPCLVVDREGQVLFLYGRTGRYLEPAGGHAGAWHVVRLMREGLRMPLITAIRRAASEGGPVHLEGVRFELEGRTESTDVSVLPLDQAIAMKGLFLVILKDPRPVPAPAALSPAAVAEAGSRQREAELERELQAAREYLQSTIEELQSANEEARSTNEELQSANEELQTSQEEAQSVNEELTTLNSQLQSKLDELQMANDDMKNLLAAVDVGILFLDRQFRVRRFNRAATRIVNLMPGDVGRPIAHISSKLRETDWLSAARRVFETLVPHQEEVEGDEGKWYAMHIQVYRTTEDAIDGVVVTFGDITVQKQLAEEVVEIVRQPLLVLDADLSVRKANRAFYQKFKVNPKETVGRLLYDLGNRQWDIPRLRELLETIIPQDSTLEGYAVEHEFEGIGRRRMVLHARRINATEGRPDLILLAFEEGEGEAHGQADVA
jgi:two-component system, chemotaxis family, CheB/CheR fusion protein